MERRRGEDIHGGALVFGGGQQQLRCCQSLPHRVFGGRRSSIRAGKRG